MHAHFSILRSLIRRSVNDVDASEKERWLASMDVFWEKISKFPHQVQVSVTDVLADAFFTPFGFDEMGRNRNIIRTFASNKPLHYLTLEGDPCTFTLDSLPVIALKPALERFAITVLDDHDTLSKALNVISRSSALTENIPERQLADFQELIFRTAHTLNH